MSEMYPILNDKDFLYNEYVIKEKGTTKIAKENNIKQSNSVRQALLKHNIPVRNRREGQTRSNEPIYIYDKQAIDGGLLGGASIGTYNKHSKMCGAYYKRRQKYKEYLIWASSYVDKDCEIRVKKDSYKNQKHESFNYRTLSSIKFREYFNRWYKKGNNYIKHVPRDLVMDEKMLLIWFLDDGSTTWRKRGSGQKKKQVLLFFSSESFSKEDNQLLCDKVNEKFNLGMKVLPCNSGSGWKCRVPQSKTNDFFKVIGECPVECYKYKWKIV